MFSKLRKKMTQDEGSSVLVTMVILIPFIWLLFGMAVDVMNMVQQKSAYVNIAQRAADNSITTIDSSGALTERSVETFVNSYRAPGLNRAEVLQGDTCRTMNVNGTERAMPYMEITLDARRSLGTSALGGEKFTAEGPAGTLQRVSAAPANHPTFRTLSATVYDASPNLVLGMFNNGCQLYKSSISSIAFGSQEDLAEDEATPAPAP